MSSGLVVVLNGNLGHSLSNAKTSQISLSLGLGVDTSKSRQNNAVISFCAKVYPTTQE